MSVTKKILKLFILAAGIALFIALFKKTSFTDLKNVFMSTNICFLLIAIITGMASTVFKALRFSCVFPTDGRQIDLYASFAFIRVLNLTFPFKSGELVALGFLKQKKLSPSISETAPAWLCLRVGDVLAIGVWFVVSCYTSTLIAGFDFDPWRVSGTLGIVLALVIVAAGLASRVQNQPKWLSQDSWITGRLRALSDGLTHIKTPRLYVRIVWWSLVIWAFLIISTTYAQMAFGSSLSFHNCLFISVIVLAVGVLPVHAPMGLGTEDAVWTGLMVLAGIETHHAIAIALNIRLFILMLVLMDGVVYLLISVFLKMHDKLSSY